MSDASAARPQPTSRQQAAKGRATALGALLVAAILVATCASPAPSGPPASTAGPGAPNASLGVPGSPGVTPLPTGSPANAAWSSVPLAPVVDVATLEPLHTVAAGVMADSAFRLTPLDGSDALAMAASLRAEPDVTFTAAIDNGAAIVTPSAPLTPGGLYRFSLQTGDGTVRAAWAVQAVGPLHIARTVPWDVTSGVPVDTGIEVTFDQDGVLLSDAEPYMSISPSVPGHLVQDGRTIAFVPDQRLAPATMYRFVVRHGLPLAGTAMTLEADVKIDFETAGDSTPNPRITFIRTLTQAVPTERAEIAIRLDDNGEDSQAVLPTRIDVAAYRLPGLNAAVAAWQTLSDAPDWGNYATTPIDTSGLPRVLSANVPIRKFTPGNTWEQWIRLPHSLPAGYYVVTIASPGGTRQIVLESTSLAVYTVVSTTRTVAWVNDAHTGKPVDGAAATLMGEALGSTGPDGLLTARTPAAMTDAAPNPDGSTVPAEALVVRKGDRSVFVEAGRPVCSTCSENPTNTWWHVLSLDRYQYRSTDTALVWGVLRNRATGKPAASVTVRLVAYSQSTGVDTTIATIKATPDASGAFLVQVPFKEVPAGDYTISVSTGKDGATEVANQSLTVAPITKPAWTLQVATSRHAILAGSKVGVTVTARFFEGTPVVGAAIKVAGDSTRDRVTTDSTGTATTTLRLPWEKGNTWEPWATTWINGRPVNPEEGSIEGGASVAVFRATVLPKVAVDSTKARVRVSGTVHDVAFARFERPGIEDLSSVDPYGALRSGATVTVSVVRHTAVRRRTGSEYDFITKRTIPVYDYDDVTKDLGSHTLVSDGQGRFTLELPALGEDQTYDLRITAIDSAGRSAPVNESASAPWTPQQDHYMQVKAAVPNPDETSLDYAIGDPIRLDISGGMGAGSAARYLWTLTGNGLKDTEITTRPHYAGTFRASDVPALQVDAVRWTGSHYEVAGGYLANFRIEDRRLTVRITPERTHYAPGDTAAASIRVTDATGSPVRASVYVHVIDEKLFAMGIATADDPLGPLYEAPDSGVIATGWTHYDLRTNDDGKGDTTGGGGDGRGDFRDWLTAQIVETGADGRATISFKISDDLTSWRILGAAVSPAFGAGSGQATIPVSIPFFAELTAAAEYLASDKPVVLVRGFGAGLAATDTVRFTISSDTLPMAATTVTAAAFQPVAVTLPALTTGVHRIRVEATSGSGATALRDVLTREIRVVATRTAQIMTTSVALTGPTPVAAGGSLTTITLSDAGRGRVVPTLWSLLTADPTRADRAYAGALAERVLRDQFGVEPTLGLNGSDLSAFNTDGIAILPYASPDLELSVLAAMTGDPRARIRDYLDNLEPTTREQQLWVLAGRAATGQSVLGDIRAAAALPDLTAEEQVVVGLAAVAAGDEPTARAIERAILAAHGEQMGPWVRVSGSVGTSDAVLTARLAIIAAALGDPLAAGMDAYIEANPPKATVLDLERALAASGWARRLPAADASAEVVVDGAPQTLDITASSPVTVSLTAAQAASATVRPISGSVVMTTQVEVPLDQSSLKAPAGITFERIVTPAGAVSATALVSVSLRVTFSAQAASTNQPCWTVTELVPSGLAPVTGQARDEEEDPSPGMVTPWRTAGQRLDFCVTPDPVQRIQTLHYLARVVTPGTYTWEPAVLQSGLVRDVGIVLVTPDLVISPLP